MELGLKAGCLERMKWAKEVEEREEGWCGNDGWIGEVLRFMLLE